MKWEQDENGHLRERRRRRPDPSPGFQAAMGALLLLLLVLGASDAVASCGIHDDPLLRAHCERARADRYNADAERELRGVQGLPGFGWLDRLRKQRARRADLDYQRDSNTDAIMRCSRQGKGVDFVTGRCQ